MGAQLNIKGYLQLDARQFHSSILIYAPFQQEVAGVIPVIQEWEMM